jgi:3-deoxy-D-manno-octulosonate 8-phosphate phosphatase KdsC-like HAD superfamily phosphatase
MGYHIIILTRLQSEPVAKYLALMGISPIFIKCEKAEKKLEQYEKSHSIEWKQVLIMGA